MKILLILITLATLQVKAQENSPRCIYDACEADSVTSTLDVDASGNTYVVFRGDTIWSTCCVDAYALHATYKETMNRCVCGKCRLFSLHYDDEEHVTIMWREGARGVYKLRHLNYYRYRDIVDHLRLYDHGIPLF